jgi:hypothetical protein
MTPEPFVSAEEAAQFLSIKRRYLLVHAHLAPPVRNSARRAFISILQSIE